MSAVLGAFNMGLAPYYDSRMWHSTDVEVVVGSFFWKTALK